MLAMGYVTGSKKERSIYVWDLSTGKVCQCFHGHKPGTGIAGAPLVVFSPDGRNLASAGMDYTVLIWDVKQPLAPGKPSQPANEKELQDLKTALISEDAAAAHQAIWKLQQIPEQALPLVSECLRRANSVSDPKKTTREVTTLIEELDSMDYQTRKKAAEELHARLFKEGFELVVENALRQTLTKRPNVEVGNAIKRLLNELAEKRKHGAASSELVRMLRSIEILELIHNDAALKLLKELVALPPRLEVRREAEAALNRLAALPAVSMIP